MELRVIIAKREDGSIEAQLLDLDMATSAPTVSGLIGAIQHALCAEYQISLENELVPFIWIPPAPEEFHRVWRSGEITGSIQELGELNLPSEVLCALACTLRADKPQFTLREMSRAA